MKKEFKEKLLAILISNLVIAIVVFVIVVIYVSCSGKCQEEKHKETNENKKNYDSAYFYYHKAMEHVFEKTDTFEMYQDSFLIYKNRAFKERNND